MIAIQTGNTLGHAVLKALGIDSANVLEVSIGMKANEMATVTITRSLDKGEGDMLATELRQYALLPVGGTVGQPCAMGVDQAAGPDMTAMAEVSPKGEITIINRVSDASFEETRTPAGDRTIALLQSEESGLRLLGHPSGPKLTHRNRNPATAHDLRAMGAGFGPAAAENTAANGAGARVRRERDGSIVVINTAPSGGKTLDVQRRVHASMLAAIQTAEFKYRNRRPAGQAPELVHLAESCGAHEVAPEQAAPPKVEDPMEAVRAVSKGQGTRP